MHKAENEMDYEKFWYDMYLHYPFRDQEEFNTRLKEWFEKNQRHSKVLQDDILSERMEQFSKTLMDHFNAEQNRIDQRYALKSDIARLAERIDELAIETSFVKNNIYELQREVFDL